MKSALWAGDKLNTQSLTRYQCLEIAMYVLRHTQDYHWYTVFNKPRRPGWDQRFEAVSKLLSTINVELKPIPDFPYSLEVTPELGQMLYLVHGIWRYLRDGIHWQYSLLEAGVGLVERFGPDIARISGYNGIETWLSEFDPVLVWSNVTSIPTTVPETANWNLIIGFAAKCCQTKPRKFQIRRTSGTTRAYGYLPEFLKWYDVNTGQTIELVEVFHRKPIKVPPLLDSIRRMSNFNERSTLSVHEAFPNYQVFEL